MIPEENRLPVTVVEDGQLLKENLRQMGKDRQWVRKVLQDRGAAEAETLLLTVDSQDHVVFLRKKRGP